MTARQRTGWRDERQRFSGDRERVEAPGGRRDAGTLPLFLLHLPAELAPGSPGGLRPQGTARTLRTLWPEGRRRRVARLRARLPARPRGVLGVPAHGGVPPLPNREDPPSGAAAGRLFGDRAQRPDP